MSDVNGQSDKQEKKDAQTKIEASQIQEDKIDGKRLGINSDNPYDMSSSDETIKVNVAEQVAIDELINTQSSEESNALLGNSADELKLQLTGSDSNGIRHDSPSVSGKEYQPNKVTHDSLPAIERDALRETAIEELSDAAIKELSDKVIESMRDSSTIRETMSNTPRDTTRNSSRSNFRNSTRNTGSSFQAKSGARISDGELLEFRLKRLIFFMGYFPKMGVILKSSQDDNFDIITDLDVYGIYIHRDFSSKAIWADCKSGQARPHDRIAWIKGVKTSIDVNDVIFVKSGVRATTKQYARKSGIQILDIRMLDKIEHDYGIKSNDWRGSWNFNALKSKRVAFSKISIPTNEVFKKISSFITTDYWTLDNFSRVKKSITALRDISTYVSIELDSEQIAAIKWAIFELVGLFTLASLNIAKEVYYFTDDEKRETIAEGLTSSEIPLKKRTEIVDASFKIVYNFVKQQFPDFIPPTKGLNLTPPGYFDAYFDLILRITNNPHDYYDVLRFVDFTMFEYDLQGKKIDEKELSQLFSNVRGNTNSSKTILHFIHQFTGVPRELFGFFH
jgi:hypothetical protein